MREGHKPWGKTSNWRTNKSTYYVQSYMVQIDIQPGARLLLSLCDQMKRQKNTVHTERAEKLGKCAQLATHAATHDNNIFREFICSCTGIWVHSLLSSVATSEENRSPEKLICFAEQHKCPPSTSAIIVIAKLALNLHRPLSSALVRVYQPESIMFI